MSKNLPTTTLRCQTWTGSARRQKVKTLEWGDLSPLF